MTTTNACRTEQASARGLPTFAAATSRRVALAAVLALHGELAAYPKPGLVSPVDSGSHRDMDAALFFRSLFSLRSYFGQITLAAMAGGGFRELNRLGRVAENRMFQATGGVNTHRGAIFNLGLLAAAAGVLLEREENLAGPALGTVVAGRWGDAIRQAGAGANEASHGLQVKARYGTGGAREEAAAGFPHVFGVGLPVLQESLRRGAGLPLATVQCLFSLMAELADTNLLYRGGMEGLELARSAARDFLGRDGVHRSGWRLHAEAIHREFVGRNLSPGGSADLLAACLFVHRLQQAFPGPAGETSV